MRFLAEDTFQHFEMPTDYGIWTNFVMDRIEYEVRQPFRYLPAFMMRYCRRHPWSVGDSFWVTLRVVMETALSGLESPALSGAGG